MKKAIIEIEVEDNFIYGECSNCPLTGYTGEIPNFLCEYN